MKTFNITLNEQQLALIGELLGNAPYKVAWPLVASINRQIAEQSQTREADLEGAEFVSAN